MSGSSLPAPLRASTCLVLCSSRSCTFSDVETQTPQSQQESNTKSSHLATKQVQTVHLSGSPEAARESSSTVKISNPGQSQSLGGTKVAQSSDRLTANSPQPRRRAASHSLDLSPPAKNISVAGLDDLTPWDVSGSCQEIGKGAFGVVSLHRHAATGTPVALKILTLPSSTAIDYQKRIEKNFQKEIDIHMALDGLQYFPKFYGAFRISGDKLSMAMEFLGDASTGKAHSIADKFDGKGPELTTVAWYDILIDVVCGLKAMHEIGILNNDLKEDNVLLVLKDRWYGKLIDFGMSSFGPRKLNMNEEAVIEYEQGVNYSHYAPECALKNQPTSQLSDLFQLGRLIGFVGQEIKIEGLLDMGNYVCSCDADKRPPLHSFLDELRIQRAAVTAV